MANLLLVDDDKDILKLGSHVLSTAGHFVFTAIDAEQALDHLGAKKIDLIISDANMPRHSGYDLLQTIKNTETLKQIPVAFLTGRREKKDIELAMKMGVVDYIVKPLDPFLLIQKVNQILVDTDITNTKTSVDLVSAPVATTAKMSIDIDLLNLTEVGLEALSPQKMNIGLKIHLQSTLFEEIGIVTPMMKVLSCVENRKQQRYNIKVQFLGLTQNDLTKIRAWIFKSSKAEVA